MSLFKEMITNLKTGFHQYLKAISENDKCSLSCAEMEVAQYEGKRERAAFKK